MPEGVRLTLEAGIGHARGVRALLVAARQAPRARRLGPELGAVLRERVDHPHPDDARIGELEQEAGVVVERPPIALGADLDHRQHPAVVDAEHLR